MKVTGDELREFMDTGWPQPEDDWYWDHDLWLHLPLRGHTYNTDDIGGILYQGKDIDPTKGEGYDLDACIKQWRRDKKRRKRTA